MNHKRGKPKSGRAGCLLCKPQKHQSVNDEKEVYHHGFGKIRMLDAQKEALDELAKLGQEMMGKDYF